IIAEYSTPLVRPFGSRVFAGEARRPGACHLEGAMARLDPPGMGLSAPRCQGRFLYVEGPGDRAILEAWAARLLPAAARRLFDSSVILGGRRPARALDHFRTRGGRRALCVLDRDDGAPAEGEGEEPGLEFFTWGRRHIESYLLVASAIGRALRLQGEDGRGGRAPGPLLPGAGGAAGSAGR